MLHSKLKLHFYAALLIITATTIFRCANSSISDGGGTDVFNATISGKINTSDSTNYNVAIVKLIPNNSNPGIVSLPDSLIDTTDENGNFKIGPVDSGNYNIVAKTDDNSYSGFLDDIHLQNSDTIVNKSISPSSDISIVLPDSLYGSEGILIIEGTDISLVIPDSLCTLSLLLPKDTLPSLQVFFDNTQTSDTILSTIPIDDSLIDLSDKQLTFLDTSGTFFHWSNLGVPSDTVIQLLIDSNQNIWSIFNSGVACLIPDTSTDSFGPVYYSKSSFSDSIDEITCAAISPIGELWLGTNGMGLYRRIIGANGSLTGAGSLKDNIYLFMSSDSISSIDFKDSTILIASPRAFSFGNYYLNNSSTLIEGAPSEVYQSSYYCGNDFILYLVNNSLESYNIFDSTGTNTPLGFSLGTDNLIKINPINKFELHGYYTSGSSSGRKVSILNFSNSSLTERSLPAISSNTTVLSSSIDKEGNEWYGLNDGTILVTDKDNENNYKLFNSLNSNILSDSVEINSIIIDRNNKLIASFGLKGFFVLNLGPE